MSELLDAVSQQPADAGTGQMWVAFSGGLDSTTLLHAMRAAYPDRTRLQAVHVHHGLQANADAWAKHCTRVCAQLLVPLHVVRVEVDRGSGQGLEAAARQARHRAFTNIMQAGDVLVTAHHQDDQAETFLLRALRASGPDGLTAMRPWRSFAQGWMWRPWLNVPRRAIAAYAQAHSLHWIEDDSNADTSLDRNFLRHQIFPLLQARWPHAAASFSRSAALAAQATDLLTAQDQATLQQMRCTGSSALSVTSLRTLTPSLRARVIRLWISQRALPPLPAQGLEQVQMSLLSAQADRQAQFNWAGVSLRRWRDQLHAGRVTAPLPPDWQARWDGRQSLQLPSGGQLQLLGAQQFDQPLRVTPRLGGERIHLAGRTHSHALKHVLQELDIPPWQRQQLPLLRDDAGEVLAAGDRVYAAKFASWLHTHNADLHWTPAGRD